MITAVSGAIKLLIITRGIKKAVNKENGNFYKSSLSSLKEM